MIKKLLVVFVALFSMSAFAQSGVSSPYSFYGIGSLKFRGTVENRSMGGLSIYTDSIHINLRNPASFTGANLATFKNENRPVKYTLGGGYTSISQESTTSTDKSASATFDYLALAFPVGKFGVGFGVLPLTSVGYRLDTTSENGDLSGRFSGDGGVNRAFLGLGYAITEDLTIGVNAQYNFGNITGSAIAFSFDGQGIPLVTQSRENNRSDLSGLTFDFGLSYKTMLTEALELVTAATYTPQGNLTSKNQKSLSTVLVNDTPGGESVRNTTEVDLERQGLLETDVTLPSKFSFGAGVGKRRKWFVGMEYEYQNTSTFSNPIFQTAATTYENASRLSLGGFYIPNYNAFKGYYKRLVYRAGVRVEQTGLNIQTESINEFGISFGVGIPVGDFGSNANLGFEVGQRGTTANNLIQENFINLQFSLSLNDKWFQKRKYD
jgi:hypothetical protein